MTSSPRIAMPESLLAALETARTRSPRAGGVRLVGTGAEPPVGERRQRQQWLRLLRERRPADAPERLEAALGEASTRAVLMLLDRQAEAAVLDPAEPGCRRAWEMLEPVGTGVCADLWIGAFAGQAPPWIFGWLDWSGEESPSLTAERCRAAAAALARVAARPAQPMVVNFSGGPDRQRSAIERLLPTLRARSATAEAALYSPLFFAEGRFQVQPWLAAVRAQAPPEVAPVLCVPQLSRAEFAAALAAAQGCWAGPFRAGAEAPAVQAHPAAAPDACAVTLDWLLRSAGL